MPVTPVIPVGAAPPLAPYSPAIKAGGWVFVSGMLAIDAHGAIVGVGDVQAQTRHVLEAIKATLAAAGGSLADIVQNQIFLKDMADYARVNEIYATYFPAHPPARYCIRADLVKPEFLVEIVATAYVGA
ncbi:pyrimidine utilization protein C [Bradyrhizobium sp. U87765 SZCCT0131]|uniref:Rid family hydrolase n=1 Tax=unclassified Bradyrhizobium TaxID=2631580 RepID=UPI001BA860B8|nr:MULTISPECIES: Rid family hydrolase [unclassified Bradyrhizobium]MBR1218821.1 pyrimidine utilization protein C [Bradyrhizobium sp. U87765 SZCCT0131]MBR1261472.1 pyrimidine utilization protein C [Bradyrhizobium sp. U87765 SZCCT0134]MBR1306675.1 pyrimidine utilization protein C [Bradyrhizobium sp. U87765 SZCCT0110]MBR1317254.1 pyrimidine utilization protein C [Bradyrhizobium sp. U87765 SZCCT0109]MBR1350956.1 pyrimidine utilization protein C [Bradyrhizobium sp. U87765 SZCCT0048]